MTYTYKYPKADHTVDAVVFGIGREGDSLEILLIERARDPFKGCFALPGGFVEMDEDLDQAVKRELAEETGLVLADSEQLHTFSSVDRDPRGRVITTAFVGVVERDEVKLCSGSDASRAVWHDVHRLPPLAFDHGEIISLALDRFRHKLTSK